MFSLTSVTDDESYDSAGSDTSDEDFSLLSQDLDGSAGDTAFSIPEATAHFDISGADVKPGHPPKWRDLRRMLLPGDVVNILGGNVWGHCGLLTRATEVYRFPVLFAKVASKDTKDGESAIRVVELDFQVDVFILEVLQSASNMPSIFLSQIGVVVHPFTRDVCIIRRVKGGVLLRNSHSGDPLIVQILISPFDDMSLDRSLLAQSVSEVMSAPETRWSPTTAVRAFFSQRAPEAIEVQQPPPAAKIGLAAGTCVAGETSVLHGSSAGVAEILAEAQPAEKSGIAKD
mmetsp:Transcript_33636/g.77643  ORF Transcript_33636/g.77643 Transcript_33636/m.77643 type:complete len:287 (-) Transcript_33636:452-1312(-)